MKLQKTTKKRFLAMLLSVAMVFTLMPTVAFAQEPTQDSGESTAVLTCEKEEHTHGEDCFEKQLTCEDTSEEHEHTDECYANVLICGQEVHTHTKECYEATEQTPKTPEVAPTCTCDSKCAEGELNAECPVCGVEGADLADCKGEAKTKVEAAELSEELKALQDRVNALPTAEEYAAMTADEQETIDNEATAIDDAYTALSDEDKALIDYAKVEALFAAMSSGIMLLGMPAAEVEPGWTGTAGTTCTMAYQYNSGSSDTMGFSYDTGGNFNIHGTFNDKWLVTTYIDCGYYTFFQNDLESSTRDEQKMKVDGTPQNTLIEGVTLDVDVKLVYEGAGLQVVYTVKNNSETQVTYSFGSAADVFIGTDDNARVTCMTNAAGDKIGFSMVSTEDTDKDGNGEYPHFNFFAADVPGMVTDVDTFWIGYYSEAGGNLYTDKRNDYFYNDSGMAYSWKAETLGAGATATYSVVFSIGGNDSANITKLHVNYTTEELSGMGSDHNYEITVDGVTYTLKPDADGNVPLVGTDLNGTSYDFIGKTLSIVRKGNTGESDSPAQQLVIAGRPATPSLAAGDIAATDDSITITPQAGAEYSIDGGNTWHKADVLTGKVTFSGLTKGSQVTVLVRTAATSSAPASNPSTGIAVTVTSPVVISIATQPTAATTVTAGSITGSLSVTATTPNVSYQWYSNTSNSATGGTAISGATSASYAIPTSLTKGEYYYYCVLSATGYDDVTTSVAKVTVKNPTADTVTIKVRDAGNWSIDNATAKLIIGETEIDLTHSSGGQYTASDVEYGLYNVEVTTTDGKTITSTITIGANTAEKVITVPNGKTNSIVETTGSDTPAIASDVNGLFTSANVVTDDNKGITEADKAAITGGGTVEIKLTAEKKNNPNDKDRITEFVKDNNATFLYVDLTVTKTVNAGTPTKLKELNDLIEIQMEIPQEYQKDTLRIFRVHEGAAEELGRGIANKNSFDEYYELSADKSIATLHVKRFSTFALTVNAVTPTPPPTDGGSSGGGSSYDYYTITATAGTGGSISTGKYVSVREGDSAGFTMTPDKGYVIADVLVNGKSVGAVANYVFTNVRSNHSITVTFKVSSGHVNPQTGVAFEDVADNDWFYEDVYRAVENGWFAGTSDTAFSPNLGTTRGMIVTVLWRMENQPKAEKAMTFTDVAENSYCYAAVAWAAEQGVIKGYDALTYKPNQVISRQELATILYRYTQLKGKDVSVGEDTNILSYTDAASVGEWAIPSMQWACGTGLMSDSDNKLMPLDQATRAQFAAVLIRLNELLVK